MVIIFSCIQILAEIRFLAWTEFRGAEVLRFCKCRPDFFNKVFDLGNIYRFLHGLFFFLKMTVQ